MGCIPIKIPNVHHNASALIARGVVIVTNDRKDTIMSTASLMEGARGEVAWGTLDDYKGSHVSIGGITSPGYVWGGRPRHDIGKPDMLYVKLLSSGRDFEVPADIVEPASVSLSLQTRIRNVLTDIGVIRKAG